MEKRVHKCKIGGCRIYCIPASYKMIHSHPVVHDVLQLLRHVSEVEKVVLVGKVCGKAKQQRYRQQYQLSLTLQFQLLARSVDASNSLEARKNKLPQLIRFKPKMMVGQFSIMRQLDNSALRQLDNSALKR